jgi:hypothetical protein
MPTSSIYYYSIDMTISKTYSTSILSRPERSEGRIEGCGLAKTRCICRTFDTRSTLFRATQAAS